MRLKVNVEIKEEIEVEVNEEIQVYVESICKRKRKFRRKSRGKPVV